MLWKVVALLHNISSFRDCTGIPNRVALYNKRDNKVTRHETLKTHSMQTYNSYQRFPKNDLLFFLKSLIRNSFCITGIPMETSRPEFRLSPSSSPYIKKINGYNNHLKTEPIIIYI
jgi:hypothetical protein